MPQEEHIITATSASLVDDFVAPKEATFPYQLQQGRMRSAFALTDARWLKVKNVLLGVNFDPDEKLILQSFEDSLTALNNAILNRQAVNFTEEAPVKGAGHTF